MTRISPVVRVAPSRGRRLVRLAALLLVLAAAPGCRLYRLERRLSPKYAEFYSQVQYIMTGEERKIFLELPDAEREPFIQEFWKRRNPFPDSPDNAFKTEYESRIRRADELFHGEGRSGYLTDRGRIYILFGPPMERLTYPMDAAGYCREVWYYGGFPVIFLDEHCQGQFLLTAVNLEHLSALNIAQGHFQQTFEQTKKFFDYDVSLVKVQSGPDLFEGRVVVDVPYAGLWFDFKDARLTTTLEVRVEVREASGAVVLDVRKAWDVGLSEDELRAKKGKSWRLEIPIVLDKDIARLRAAALTLHVGVRNIAAGEELKKVVEFRLEP
jgi:GWxTD domain-containing protein